MVDLSPSNLDFHSLYEYLIENSSFLVDKNLDHFTGTGFAVALDGYTIQVPSYILNYDIFKPIMKTFMRNIEGDLFIHAWLDEIQLIFNFSISIIDDNVESALDRAERKREGSLRPLIYYKIKRVGSVPDSSSSNDLT